MKKAVGQTFLSDTDTAEEREIDLMVYKLYELTFEEAKIIEPDINISREEYKEYGINQVKK